MDLISESKVADLPEPQVPIRNIGEILDKEIPKRVGEELTIRWNLLKKKFWKIFLKIFGGIWVLIVTIATVFARRY